MGDLAGSLRAERAEERAEGGLVLTWGCPHEAATVVVDDDAQILVAALVGDLINPDPRQVGELVMKFAGVIPDSGDDCPDGAPRDPHQLGDRSLRRLGGKPRDLCIEVVGVTGLMPGPRNGRHGHTISPTRHPRSVGFQIHLNCPGIQRTPAPPPTAEVVSRTPSTARPASVPHRPGWPDRDDQNPGVVTYFHGLDNRFLDTEQGPPYGWISHAVFLS